ncbi:MAG TPA: extracellular solute-binding protein [Thermomicrobiales bacterium]
MGEQTAFDVELQAWSKLTGASIDNTHINQDQGDFAPRQDAAVKGGSVQDMCYCTGLVSQWQQLGDITDVSDVVAEIQQAYGPVEDYLKSGLFIDGKWWAIPYYSNVTATFLRKDWLDAKGVKLSDIKTFENARDVALEISDPTKNQFGWGITWNRSGDGNYLITSVLNSYGGAVYSDDGTKVVFNSPETIAAITFLSDLYTNAKYRNMLPPGVNGWTDPSNNQAWLAGIIGFTQNAYTLYAQSKADKNPVYDKTAVIPGLIGPGTEQVIPNPGYGAFVIFKGAKNPALAKATAKYMVGGATLLDIAKQANGIVMPAYKKQWDADPFWSQGDPSFSSLRTLIEGPYRSRARPGTTSRKRRAGPETRYPASMSCPICWGTSSSRGRRSPMPSRRPMTGWCKSSSSSATSNSDVVGTSPPAPLLCLGQRRGEKYEIPLLPAFAPPLLSLAMERGPGGEVPAAPIDTEYRRCYNRGTMKPAQRRRCHRAPTTAGGRERATGVDAA